MKRLLLIVGVLILTGCHRETKPAPLPPGKAVLVSPAENSVCTTGVVISDTQSNITFTWDASANTSSYDLYITNLLTSAAIATQNTTDTKLTLALARGTPYAWYIVSRSSQTNATTRSDTSKFYNAGPGIVTYAPFPADITSPAFGAEVMVMGGTIDLTWTGSDVENDIVGYDVYFGTGMSPALFKSGITNMFLNGVSVTSGTTYYWKVMTKDSHGNTSDSGLYQFSVM